MIGEGRVNDDYKRIRSFAWGVVAPEKQGKAVLNIVCRFADEDVWIQPTGMGAGELLSTSSIDFLGEPLQSSVLGLENKHMVVLYNSAAEFQRSAVFFVISLNYTGDWTDESGLTAQNEAISEQILRSVRWSDKLT